MGFKDPLPKSPYMLAELEQRSIAGLQVGTSQCCRECEEQCCIRGHRAFGGHLVGNLSEFLIYP